MRLSRFLTCSVMGLTVCAAAAGAPGAHASARVGAAKASLGTYAGNWTGHTRSLRISTAGHAKELVGDGCCDPIVNLRFTISHVTGTKAKASATATVTRVHVEDKSAFSKKYPAPKVGDTGKLRLKHGIITEPFVGAVYCDRSKENQGACGA